MMTFLGFVLKKIDENSRLNPYHKYTGFQHSYRDSEARDRAIRLQSAIWILAIVVSRIVGNDQTIGLPVLSRFIGDVTYETAVLIASALVAIGVVYFVIPGIHYVRASPFRFEFDWFPITDDRQKLQQSHNDELRLSGNDWKQIAAIFDVPGRINGYDFKFVTTSNPIDMRIGPVIAPNQEKYPDNEGIYDKSTIESDDFVNIIEVRATGPIGGGPSQYAKIIDVSDIIAAEDIEYGQEIDPDRAEEEGETIVKIEVVE